mgnify:FL=1|tara:strand:+ start:5604 stop:6218 length:615 start_codon:yes stop_codon:yes gene_type:complete
MVFGQTVYQDSLATSFSISSSFSKTSDAQVFGYGLNVAFKNGINLGLIRTNQKDLAAAESRDRINGKGWGGYLSLMFANELKGDPLGVEAGFIFSAGTYRQESQPDYELKTNQAGVSVSASKRLRMSDRSLLVPQLSYSFLPIYKAQEKNKWRSHYFAHKTSTVNFTLGFTRDKNTFTYVIDSSVALDTNTSTILGAVGFTIYP